MMVPDSEKGVTLSATRLYDFCEPSDRIEWANVVIALIEYLRSGKSLVGPLNKNLAKNMLHKEYGQSSAVESLAIPATVMGLAASEVGTTGEKSSEMRASQLRRSSRKRKFIE